MGTSLTDDFRKALNASIPEEIREHTAESSAKALREQSIPVRLAFTWMGVRRAMSRDQKDTAAEAFGANGSFLTASKKLINTKHPAFRAVTGVRGKIRGYWKAMTLPYPEDGIRLLRRSQLETFQKQMAEMETELMSRVAELQPFYSELKNEARRMLGSLYSESDYGDDIASLFNVEWDFPNVEPPNYLADLDPSLFAAEQERAAARFGVAVAMAEEAFADELGKLVTHLHECLTGPNSKTILADLKEKQLPIVKIAVLRENEATVDKKRTIHQIGDRPDGGHWYVAIEWANEPVDADIKTANDTLASRQHNGMFFKNNSVQNVHTFLDRFKQLDIGGNARLKRLAEQTEQLLAGQDAQKFRDSATTRETVANGLADIQADLADMMTSKPARGRGRRTFDVS